MFIPSFKLLDSPKINITKYRQSIDFFFQITFVIKFCFLCLLSYLALEFDLHNLHLHHVIADLSEETKKAADRRISQIVVA